MAKIDGQLMPHCESGDENPLIAEARSELKFQQLTEPETKDKSR
jgi:hypothetical protein